MSTFLYVRTTMDIPGVGLTIHLAELEELDAQSCHMRRMVSLAPNDAVVGMATPQAAAGNAQMPQPVVPHPDMYHQFADITAELSDAGSFEAYWSEALAKFPSF